MSLPNTAGKIVRLDNPKKLAIAAFAACMAACSNGLTAEQQAALAAEGYYRHLAAGEYEQFLQGKAGADSLPELYREQLLTAYSQFTDQQRKQHQGISGVQVSNARTDSLEGCTAVFLLLSYGDSTQEEIVVPMVCRNGQWRMK